MSVSFVKMACSHSIQPNLTSNIYRNYQPVCDITSTSDKGTVNHSLKYYNPNGPTSRMYLASIPFPSANKF